MKSLLLTLTLLATPALAQGPPAPSIAGSECWELFLPRWADVPDEIYCPDSGFNEAANLADCKRAFEIATFDAMLEYIDAANDIVISWHQDRVWLETAWNNCALSDDECRAAIAALVCEFRASYQEAIFALWDDILMQTVGARANYEQCVLDACVAGYYDCDFNHPVPGSPVQFLPFPAPNCGIAPPNPVCVDITTQQFGANRLLILQMKFEKQWFDAVAQYQADIAAAHENIGIFWGKGDYCAQVGAMRTALYSALLVTHASIEAEAQAAYQELLAEWAALVILNCCDN